MTVVARDLETRLARARSDVREDKVLEVLAVLLSRASPPGRERALAEDVAAWGARAGGDVVWEVDAVDDASANVIARSVLGDARELAMYSHLDTSLTGEATSDFAITGELAVNAPFSFTDDRMLRGFGVGIAKAPSAAAIVSFFSAAAALRELAVPHRLTLLLAAGGTHRAAPADGPAPAERFGRGVAHALATGWRPSAVLNVKGGPRGVLHEEPGAAYLRVRLRARWTAALVRASVAPQGGLVRHSGAVLDAIEKWRESYLRSHPPAGQLANEIVIGAIRGGTAAKADLIPGLLEVFVYAILIPSEDPARVARELETHLRGAVANLPDHPSVEVDVYASAPGGTTDPTSEIVRLANDAWLQHVGSDPKTVTGWTGATDGGVFRASGIPTARMGAAVKRDGKDPRIEIVAMDDLIALARAHVDVVVRYFATGPYLPGAA
jgi:acetylornithine deacetylase/succinyl-diaminopimelate desuccinylase-like protein